MTDYTSLVTALRTKTSRDNRKLLDDAVEVIERLQRERDAAVADLRDECGCTFCRFGEYEISELPRRCRDCFHFKNWEWRGIDG